jgi:hypothetical protein
MSLRQQFTALAAALVLATVACNDGSAPTGPSAGASTPAGLSESWTGWGTGTSSPHWLKCGGQTDYKTTKTVGTAGGQIVAGRYKLSIPAGALSQPVTITMEALPDSIVSVKFGPEGLRFSPWHQPTLTASVTGCWLPAGVTPRLAYVTDWYAVLSQLPSQWSPMSSSVWAPLGHFSRYAVFY